MCIKRRVRVIHNADLVQSVDVISTTLRLRHRCVYSSWRPSIRCDWVITVRACARVRGCVRATAGIPQG